MVTHKTSRIVQAPGGPQISVPVPSTGCSFFVYGPWTCGVANDVTLSTWPGAPLMTIEQGWIPWAVWGAFYEPYEDGSPTFQYLVPHGPNGEMIGNINNPGSFGIFHAGQLLGVGPSPTNGGSTDATMAAPKVMTLDPNDLNQQPRDGVAQMSYEGQGMIGSIALEPFTLHLSAIAEGWEWDPALVPPSPWELGTRTRDPDLPLTAGHVDVYLAVMQPIVVTQIT